MIVVSTAFDFEVAFVFDLFLLLKLFCFVMGSFITITKPVHEGRAKLGLLTGQPRRLS